MNLNFVFFVFSYGLWVLISVSAIRCKIETKKSSFKLQKSLAFVRCPALRVTEQTQTVTLRINFTDCMKELVLLIKLSQGCMPLVFWHATNSTIIAFVYLYLAFVYFIDITHFEVGCDVLIKLFRRWRNSFNEKILLRS